MEKPRIVPQQLYIERKAAGAVREFKLPNAVNVGGHWVLNDTLLSTVAATLGVEFEQGDNTPEKFVLKVK